MLKGPIGVFDSGYGGLTVLKAITSKLPQYNYVYLGDNARAPYGNRSFDTVYQYTLQCVQWFFKQGCPLVILACNTASAKALRTIQQNDLPNIDLEKRVLGVIRPTSEIIGQFTKTGHVGILGTTGTIQSQSYLIEIKKFFPDCNVYQQACPMWVPLVENKEFDNPGADYFIEKNILRLDRRTIKKCSFFIKVCCIICCIKLKFACFYTIIFNSRMPIQIIRQAIGYNITLSNNSGGWRNKLF